MRPFLIVGNLKMNLLTRSECEKYLALLRKEMTGKRFPSVKGILCPPTIHLTRFTHLPEGWSLGAQDTAPERSGAFTGETSPLMLKDAGVGAVIVGHSERRQYSAETDELISRKVHILLKHLITPVLCIGETAEERRREATTDVLEQQLGAVFQDLSPMQAEKITLAYEPRWAIGTDVLPTTEEILQVKVFFRKFFTTRYDARLAERMEILYGGSVTAPTLGAVSWEADMNGVLVGRDSLFPHALVKMMELAEAAKARTAH